MVEKKHNKKRIAFPDKIFNLGIDDVLHTVYEVDKSGWSSIFEQKELNFLERMHRIYGLKVALNLFYEPKPEDKPSTNVPLDWNLSQMTDKYISEFQTNSNWLKFSFHARSHTPYYPYKNATYAEAKAIFNLIKKEVDRFAGSKCWTYFSTVHFGAGTREAVRAWRDLGVKGLRGASNDYGTNYPTYYMEVGSEPWQYLNEHDYLIDTEESMIFIHHDVWFEKLKGSLSEWLDNFTTTKPEQSKIIDLCIHDYSDALQDEYQQRRIEASLKWLTEHGYKPVFYDEYL